MHTPRLLACRTSALTSLCSSPQLLWCPGPTSYLPWLPPIPASASAGEAPTCLGHHLAHSIQVSTQTPPPRRGPPCPPCWLPIPSLSIPFSSSLSSKHLSVSESTLLIHFFTLFFAYYALLIDQLISTLWLSPHPSHGVQPVPRRCRRSIHILS